jgi:hypothetical protein
MRKILFLAILFSLSAYSYAQVQLPLGTKSTFGQRLYFGGSMGFQLGTITYVDVSPLAGYMISRKLSAGVGITYRYLKYRNINYETHIYGGRLFARHNIALFNLPLFLYGEYENLNLEYAKYTSISTYELTREWVPSVLVGGGLFQPIGTRAGFMIMALYNLIYDEVRSPYNSPWVVRVGFTM